VGGRKHLEQGVGDREHVLDREPAFARESLLERLTVEQVHHEERQPVRGRVVVQYTDAPRMLDPIRDVPLTEKPFANLRDRRKLGVQHLHRYALAVAVRRGIDGRNASFPEERIDAPFFLQNDAGEIGRHDHPVYRSSRDRNLIFV